MKKLGALVLLAAAVVVATVLINTLGLFKRHTLPPTAPQAPGFSRRPDLSNPASLMGVPTSTPRSLASGSAKKEVPVSRAEIAEALNDWTYPGAAITVNEFAGAGASGQKTSSGRQYSRLLVTSAPPADVWRFYGSKAGSGPAANNPAPQAAGPAIPGSPAASGGMPSPVAGIYVTRYSKATKDYLVSVIVFHQNGTPRTQITLLLDPRTAVSSSTQKAGEPGSGRQPQ